MTDIPKKYKAPEAESKWQENWEKSGIYRWDAAKDRADNFVIDTPPPTVSGSLHIGHVFSYSHQDFIARFQRMRGKNISYPMGWDDNGLPTERRVQNIFGIRCEPRLPYDPDWQPRRDKKKKDPIEEVSRRNFIEACAIITAEDEIAFEQMWRRLGLSIDWDRQYATINDHCRTTSQLSFLKLVEQGEVYNTEAPTMWDIDFKTAVAQAEAEDKPCPGFMHEVRFAVKEGGEFKISTTRPELLPACIAVVAHPDDERYKDLFGKTAVTPLFGAEVPIMAAEHADPEKGTGILMVCTFGDSNDVDWWKTSGMPLKQIIGLNGRLVDIRFGEGVYQSCDPEAAQAAYGEISGLYPKQAKKRIAELLAADGTGPMGDGAALAGEPEAIEHPVKFYEKGDRPLEFVPTRQWFTRILKHKEDLLKQGAKINWHPSFMRSRYDNWVEGLNQDWCISRQRYFGVPFPVWYPVHENGLPNYEKPIFAAAASLPVDPLAEPAPGYEESQRGEAGGFIGDNDVMDTWATSSLSPLIASDWANDADKHQKLFPMDIRPQSHEIIRTWAFYTIVKAWMHEGEIPWRDVVISGWILDPDRKKMSKSKGNVVTPEKILDDNSVDGVRYWAARARLGADTAFDETVFKIGKKLATKIFNASRFVFSQVDSAMADTNGEVYGLDAVIEPLDVAVIKRVRGIVTQATASFERYDYAAALQVSEEGFWNFCDHYLELVKGRSYADEDSPARRSAIATLNYCLKTYLRLLAPVLPYVTEEVWSWRLAGEGRDKSIHTTAWPQVEETAALSIEVPEQAYDCAIDVLSQIRGIKSDAQKTLKWPIAKLKISGSESDISALRSVFSDLCEAGCVVDSSPELMVEKMPEDQRFILDVELGTELEN